MELELEMVPAARDNWLKIEDHSTLNTMTSKLASHLVQLLVSINPLQPLDCTSVVQREKDEGLWEAVRTACVQLRGGRAGKDSLFPGAQPVNMCKRNVHEVQSLPYFVAEKTDGVRYLMMALSSRSGTQTAVLVDRSMSLFKVAGGEYIGRVLGMGTILDGELVLQRDRNQAVFIAFDILRCRDRVILQKLFRDRLVELHGVFQAYEEQVHRGDQPEHLPLLQKRYFKRKNIMELFRNVHCEGRERVYRDGSVRHHKTDGVIFQPNTPYIIGTDRRLLKWKWVDLASVDLRAYPPSGMGDGRSLRLCTEASDHQEVDMSAIVHLTEQDKSRLLADLSNRPSIAEVALDPGSGLWVYMGMRPDKDRPNFVTTVMATIVEVAEGLSEEELKYRMLVNKPSEDDWAGQEEVMRQRAVVWQYGRK
ncbi:unnamed protein product, partial [Discosporangium mesarthrocarpum]